MRLAGIPANVITGPAAAKRRLLEHVLSLRPASERWALLDNDATGIEAPGTGLHVNELAEGCVCCAAQVNLRVALTRLLRLARPQRLLVLPSRQADSGQVLRLLSDRWLSPVLDLRASIHALEDNPAKALPGDGARACLESADIVAVEAAKNQAIRQSIIAMAPQARVVEIGGTSRDLGWLDMPARRSRPLFKTDNNL